MKTIITLILFCGFGFRVNAQVSFTLSSTPGVGTGPVAVFAADVNRDGKLDLISANVWSSSVSVSTNNGTGGFVLASTLNVGAHPYSVIAADVNGDGVVDLISANRDDSTLTVLTNNGSGGFVLSATLNVGSNPGAVTAADVNGDGKLDLISANNSANSLTVLTNNGNGGFVLAATLGVGGYPNMVRAADMNGDGKLDLISANYSGNSISVLTNNGSGGFVLAATPSVGANPYWVTAADVNGDNKLDLISDNSGGNTLSVLTNNGSGGFVLASSPVVGSGPVSISAADVNGKQTKRILYVVPNFRSVSVDEILPPQSPKEKVILMLQDSFDYSTLIYVGGVAGVSDAQRSTPEFGHGAAAYGRYYWHEFADNLDGNIFTEAIVPIITHEDPRYYTLGRGGIFKRSVYSVSRLLITRTDLTATNNAHNTFNISEIVGNGAAAGISGLYYPSKDYTWTKTGQKWVLQIGLDGGSNLVKEFWPDVNAYIFHNSSW